MSVPQHSGDLIFPCPFGHTEIATLEPSSFTRTSSTKAASHAPQVVLTDIPHAAHVYRAMVGNLDQEGPKRGPSVQIRESGVAAYGRKERGEGRLLLA